MTKPIQPWPRAAGKIDWTQHEGAIRRVLIALGVRTRSGPVYPAL
ncbi:hypothetical protein WGT02_28865 (plasmid) [Rhizobium sp. T1470]